MATKFPELFATLSAEFDPWEVKTRPAQGGRHLSYVTARTIQNRFDFTFGPENWRPEYFETEKGIKCRLHVRTPDGEWHWKEDGGGFAGMSDEQDDQKSGYSDAFKRAAVAWGCSRYLYRDGQASYGGESNGHAPPEQVPARGPEPPPRREPERPARNGSGDDRPPTSGKALFAWIKKQEERHETAILPKIDKWAKAEGYPFKMIEWTPEQVATAHARAVDYLGRLEDQSEPEPAPAANGHAGPGMPEPTPEDIDNADPLKSEKLSIKRAARQEFMAERHRPPGPGELLAYLNTFLTDQGGESINLRECRDKPVIDWLKEEFEAKVNDRRKGATA